MKTFDQSTPAFPEPEPTMIDGPMPAATSDRICKSAVMRVYRRFAPVYDATFGAFVTRHRRRIAQCVAANGPTNVLEVGVGTGLTLPLYPRGTKVIGIDLCREMLGRARQRVERGVSADVVLQLGDGERLPFPNESFDFVVMAFVVSVTPNPHVLMAEVTRVLRPAGTLLIINHFSGVRGITCIERAIAPFAGRIGFRSNFPIKRILNQTGLTVLEVKPLGAWGLFHLVRMAKGPVSDQD